MLKYNSAISVFFLLCVLLPPQLALSEVPLRANVVSTDLCINSDNDWSCQQRTRTEVMVHHGEPVTLYVSYVTGSTDDYFEDPGIQITVTKTVPKNVFPLTFRHTVRTLSSIPGAKNGTVDSPYAEYRAFAVGPARRDYGVTIEVQLGTTLLNRFTLTTEDPTYRDVTNIHQFVARLQDEHTAPVNDGAPAGSILFVPFDKQNNTLMPVYEGLLLSQADAAEIIDARQLNQLRDADIARVAATPDAEADYLVKHKRIFKDSITDMGGELMLVQQINDPYSTVHFEFDKAMIGEIKYEAMAWIKGASVAPFEAMSPNGRLDVTIENVGVVDAGFEVTVHDCTFPMPMVGGSYYIPFKSQRAFSINIPVTVDLDDTHYCHVTLWSTTGKTLDSVKVLFTAYTANTPRFQY